ncbi:recombinase family protein [Bradyrhizobium japonicum]|uniref:recombinase family protein n=1 Tax=Bradyrhizobium japonicum TaxID=375 RepID=UPI00271484C1|nr:recombinase family protein [Bradyrhizobium japonicum]WLB21916.1 recombinase family protein [Bradyrhizobium japonicum]
MKSYFAYIRVSTVRQGERGSSLQEQRDAITAFARRNELTITQWFEERETAAKIGRSEFMRMVAAVKKQRASGIIFHKIDRSSRNLKDWSVIQDLADAGLDIRFAQESINLASNEGKLTGDFLAVIAAHYIRNLREEVKKGMRGRLKQGIYPLAAPTGYLDQGGGKPKIPDPQRAPYVRDAFEWYADGRYSLRTLSDELYERGFRTKSGKKVDASCLQKMLRNPFYIGVIRISGEVYAGIHEPIISKALFDRVQQHLDGKKNARAIVHDFLFRRMISCTNCHYCLIGERQKGYVYYRCHTPTCPTLTVREDVILSAFQTHLVPLRFEEDEISELRQMIAAHFDRKSERKEEHLHAVELRLEASRARLSRLIDAYTDGMLEKPLFMEKKLALIMEQRGLEEEYDTIDGTETLFAQKLDEILELLKSLPLCYENANPLERRSLIKEITSNIKVDRKELDITLRSPFREIASVGYVSSGGHVCDKARTNRIQSVVEVLMKWCGPGGQTSSSPPYAPPLTPPLR